MKKALGLLLLAAAMATPASAASTQFLGYFCITTNPLNAACVDDGIGLGECATLRYLPPNVGTNGASTRLSIFEQHWAENYTLPSGSLVGTTFKNVNGVGIAGGTWSFVSKMRITSQSPAAPATTTKTIALAGDIQDYDGAPGCDVSFRAAVTLRPPN